MLEPDEVAAILRAYSHLKLTPKNLGLLGQYRKDEFASWVLVGVQYKDTLIRMNEQMVEVLDGALAGLRS